MSGGKMNYLYMKESPKFLLEENLEILYKAMDYYSEFENNEAFCKMDDFIAGLERIQKQLDSWVDAHRSFMHATEWQLSGDGWPENSFQRILAELSGVRSPSIWD